MTRMQRMLLIAALTGGVFALEAVAAAGVVIAAMTAVLIAAGYLTLRSPVRAR
jgi:hypothetical protein